MRSMAVIKEYVLIGVLFCIPFMQIGCNKTGDMMLDNNDSGSRIELSKGDEISITLESNPSTGYTWQVVEIDNQVIKQLGEPEFILPGETNHPQPGKGGVEIFRFSAVSPGRANLHLIYVRSWDEDQQPAQEFFIDVVVN